MIGASEANRRAVGSILVKLGYLSEEDVTNFLSRQYGVPAINLSYFEIDPAVVKLIPFETAKRYQILPLSRVGASLTIAMVDPTNVFAMDDIKFMTGLNVEPVIASESSIQTAIANFVQRHPIKGGAVAIGVSGLLESVSPHRITPGKLDNLGVIDVRHPRPATVVRSISLRS